MTQRPKCSMCGIKMRITTPNQTNGSPSPQRMSRDHILPRSRGGTELLPEGVKNLRIMCQVCNNRLAACCHCVAMLACVRAVAAERMTTDLVVMQDWQIGRVRHEMNVRDGAARKAARYRRLLA